MQKTIGKHAALARDEVSRRGFLQVGAAGALGVSLPAVLAVKAAGTVARSRDERAAIMIFNLGGPSQLDTFDPKPDAPAEIRGPFRPISTNVPGVQISELFPLHARIADKFSLVRGCFHTAPAVHDVGHQLMQTGRLFTDEVRYPHVGSVASYLLGPRSGLPAHVVLPLPMGPTGGNLPHGQDAGFLGAEHDPFVPGDDTSFQALAAFDISKEPLRVRERYGQTRFGESCLRARRLVEAGVRFVTLNTFATVFNEVSWDTHGLSPFSTIHDLKNIVAPMYDRAYTVLIEDLDQRGLLPSTLVCNLAEFGRTPRINPAGGRDHWPHCWTVYFAGGGVQGGRVIGRSDAVGGIPADRPVEPAEIIATIYQSLGVDPQTELRGAAVPLVERGKSAIRELF